MFKFIRKKVFRYFAPIIIGILALPAVGKAQSSVQSGLTNLRGKISGFNSGPFSNVRNIPDFIAVVIMILLLIAGALAVLFVIIGGYQYLTSAGNEEQAEKGKKTLINSIIGIVLIILSWVIVNVIAGTIGGGTTGWFFGL